MSIHGIPEGDISQAKLSFEMSSGNRADMGIWDYRSGTKPQKIGWRNKQGTPDKLIKHFEEYLRKTKEVISKREDMK
jgi:hypothetical protein